MATPFRPLAALRAALLADAPLAALVGTRVFVAYPWDVQEAAYPLVALWQEQDVQAVSFPRTNDPARVRVDAVSQVDADEAARLYERVYLVLHKREATLGLVGEACIKECRQVWAAFPMWDAKLQAWSAPSRFLVRAHTLG